MTKKGPFSNKNNINFLFKTLRELSFHPVNLLKACGITLLLSASLVGCGGGGGGGGGGGVSDPAPVVNNNPVPINAANARQVTGATVDASIGLVDGGEATNLLTGVVVQTSSGNINIVDIIMSQIKAAPGLTTGTESVVGVLIDSGTLLCDISGTFRIVFDDADNSDSLTTGDTMTMTASNCNEAGVVLNGSLSIDNIVMSGDLLSVYTLALRMQASSFSVAEAGQTVVLNGDMNISESFDGSILDLSITGSSIQLTVDGSTDTLTSFSIIVTDNAGDYTFDINSTVSSPDIGGSVTIVTNTLFAGNDLNDPYDGEATITGANGSSITLIVLDSVNVRLEIDSDGDGAIDDTIDTTWNNL